MKQLHRKPVLIVATFALLGAGAALQAVASAQSESLSEVVVRSGPVSRTVVGRGLATSIPIERTSVDYHVSYADLDLSKHADVLTLQERVEQAARGACGQLDELYPFDSAHARHQTGAVCVHDALQGAAPQIQEAIEAGQTQADLE